MNKMRLVYSLLMFLMMTTIAWGLSNATGKWHSPQQALIQDTDTRLDVNNLEMFVYNDGNFAYDNANVLGKTDGLYFPRGTKKTVIYAAGMWIGAKVNDDIRLAIAEFSSEYVPGPMNDGTYQPDNAAFRVYKVRQGDTPQSNPDYANWPVDQGAPLDSLGNPKITGDLMTWAVFNDADPSAHENDAASTAPLGVEVQMEAFGYARGGALGNTIFFRYTIINKGGNTLDSSFISLWADADNGNASDDLVGCDTTLSLGYCYNDGDDVNYGANPPAVGFDFFQGPIDSTGLASDTAFVGPDTLVGFKELGMVSFNKYINGTDPASRTESYGYMKGLSKDPISGQMVPTVNPVTDEVTLYSVSGDPVTGTGWVDEAAADRRFMMSSGPFTMDPGDTQIVVAAVIVAQGANPLNSITALKNADDAAQTVFDLNFDIPSPPPSPSVIVRGGDREIDIIWGEEAIGSVEENEKLNQRFIHEGYNVYQGESPTGPWHKIATSDLEDDYSLLYYDVVDPAAGGVQRIITQKGDNTGLAQHMLITNDQLGGGTLLNNQPYYFAVTAYSLDENNVIEFRDQGNNLLGHIVESLESPIISYEVRPFTHVGQYRVQAEHFSGKSDGEVVSEVIVPDDIITADWQVDFNEDFSWNLTNLTTNTTAMSEQTQQDGNYNYDTLSGMMVRVSGPNPGVKEEIYEVDSLTVLSLGLGQAYMAARNAVVNNDYRDFLIEFVVGSDDKVWAQIDEVSEDLKDTTGIFRYLDENGDTLWAYPVGSESDADRFSVPFRLWDLGDDYREPSPVQLQVITYDFYGDGNFYLDDYIILNDKNTGGNLVAEDFFAAHPEQRSGEYWFFDDTDPVSRHDWDYRIGFAAVVPWKAGDSAIIVTNKPNTQADVFRFSTTSLTAADGEFIRASLDDIKTVPNPYYAFNPEEVDQFDRIIKFINLPPRQKMTIRIYNIAGDLIRTLERPETETFPEFVWDLKTDAGLWVASGVYVWVIEADGLGTKFGKMAIFPEVEQLDTF